MAEYQEMVEANARVQLGMILSTKTQMLQMIIEDGLSEATSPRDRMAIYRSLNELEQGLNTALQIESEAYAAAHEFLKRGPTTTKQRSRLTATRETVTIESEG